MRIHENNAGTSAETLPVEESVYTTVAGDQLDSFNVVRRHRRADPSDVSKLVTRTRHP